MMTPARRLLTAALALALVAPSCSFLRDKEPWDETIIYRNGPEGELIVEPLTLQGDSNYGIITVVNETAERRGFAIEKLAVFEEIPPGLTIGVDVDEAQDGESYEFFDHVTEEDWRGVLVIEYVEEEFRDR